MMGKHSVAGSLQKSIRAPLDWQLGLMLFYWFLAWPPWKAYVTAKLDDGQVRTNVLTSLAAFGLVSVVRWFFNRSPYVVMIGIAVWGLTFEGSATLIQVSPVDAAGEDGEVALSMMVVTWHVAIIPDGFLRCAPWSAVSELVPMVDAGFTGGCTCIAWSAQIKGFPSGRRLSPQRVR